MNNTENKSKPTSMDRASFIVGLSAALLAFYPYKDKLDATIIHIFGWNLSVYSAGLFFLGLMLISAYIYGLNNIRYSINTLLGLEFLRYLEIVALASYIIAFIFPIILFLLWLFSLSLNSISNGQKLYFFNILSTILSAVIALISGRLSLVFYRNQKNDIIDNLTDVGSELSKKAQKQDDYKISILNSYQSLISILKAHLVPRIGTAAENLTDSQVIKIASDKQIIDAGDMKVVEELRKARNIISHDIQSLNLTQEEITILRAKITRILLKLYRDRVAYIISK